MKEKLHGRVEPRQLEAPKCGVFRHDIAGMVRRSLCRPVMPVLRICSGSYLVADCRTIVEIARSSTLPRPRMSEARPTRGERPFLAEQYLPI